MWALPELVEAAARVGETAVAREAFDRLAEMTQPAGTDGRCGTEARSRALLSDGEDAGPPDRQAIERFGRTGLRPDLARAHLLYGEWLRREGRRIDGREQLCMALPMFASIGMEAFAERARRELLATGERARKLMKHPRRSHGSGRHRSRSLHARGTPTRRSAHGCSSADVPSSGTCARYSPSSTSAPAKSSTRRSTRARELQPV